MQITITARHFELTEPIKEHAETSIMGLKKYFEQIIIADMVLRVEKNRNIAELHIKVKKLSLICKSREKDMYTAIDSTVKKMERQIKRYIGKLQRHHSNKNISIKNIPQKESKQQYSILHKKIVPIELNEDQAIKELQNSKKDYLLFKNNENKKLNILKKVNNNYEFTEIQ
ncbi:MAG: ribosome-associated translation inhibitor RaiA [Candidatus Cloacimonetes bacterium]|nr:ribosome-associated translation inhibitor RaiA [Candidatus Cloacimonadota bacterium]